MSSKQVAIIGLPRSGTTWIAKIIDCHPDVFYQHEPDYSKRLPCVPYVTAGDEYKVWQPFIQQWVSELTQSGQIRNFGKRPFHPKSYSSPFPKAQSPLFDIWNWKTVTLKILSRLLNANFTIQLPSRIKTAKVHLWKSVEMTGRLPSLARSVPDVDFVHVVCHPCGFIASVLRGEKLAKFENEIPMSEDMGLLHLALQTRTTDNNLISIDELARSDKVVRLAWLWNFFNDHALTNCCTLRNYNLLYYDDFAADSIRQSTNLLKTLNLSPCGTVETFLAYKRKSAKAEFYSMNHNSISAASRWKNELTEDQIADVLDICKGTICKIAEQSL